MKAKTIILTGLLGILLFTACDKSTIKPTTTSNVAPSANSKCLTIKDQQSGSPLQNVKVKYTLISGGSGWHLPYGNDSVYTDQNGKICVTMPQPDNFYELRLSKEGYDATYFSTISGSEFRMSAVGFLKIHLKQVSTPDTLRDITIRYIPNPDGTSYGYNAFNGTNIDTTFTIPMSPKTDKIIWTTYYPSSGLHTEEKPVIITSKQTSTIEIKF